jgi:predicted DCC family thiol-disulfide oxidoreductase YuxK
MTARGFILYDDVCGFCRAWIPFWAGTLRRRGFDVAPLQSAWVRERLRVDDDGLLDDLLLLRDDGTIVRGADVYRYVARRIWWAVPLYVLSVTPGLRQVFDAGYRAFARNRYHFSRSCGLQGR